MSVPAVLNVVEPQSSSLLLDDEHMKNCVSYVDAAPGSVIANGYAATTLTAACTPAVRYFNVQLMEPLAAEERLGLTGDAKALGEWQLQRSVALQPYSALEWRANVMLQSCRHIEYRYFVYVEQEAAAGQKQLRRWETHFRPRVLRPIAKPSTEQEQQQQQLEQLEQHDRFGIDAEGVRQLHRGWLMNDAILQLKFVRERMFQVHDIERFDPEQMQLRLVPLANAPASANQAPLIEVSKQEYGTSALRAQPQPYGAQYTRGDILIFHVTLSLPLPLAPPLTQPLTQPQRFELQCHNMAGKLLGSAAFDAAQLTGSEGLLELELTEPNDAASKTLARLRLPWLLVRPCAEACSKLDFRTTYAHYWPKSWPNLDVGHRGNGKSYIAKPPKELENTVASFMSAYASYADMIELDVHLTADGVPVIYHDFGLRTAPRDKTITRAQQLEYVLIKDVAYAQLQQLRVFALINGSVVEYPAHNAEPRHAQRIFPRLEDVLGMLPKTLGIDVEIKWPQALANGGVEAEQTLDKNFFADRVLSTVIRHGCGRPLIFSSFDADMCTLLRFKQNLFPVMFLSMGETKKWQPFMDLRTRNFVAAINNAQAFELAGTAPHAEDFLHEQGAALMRKAHAMGQIAVVWGDDCNSRERVRYFTEIGATATCYDRSDLNMREGKQRSFFDTPAMKAQFEPQCRV